tara:strand:+ start:169 stop:465 length:297 start_codon:yes stop_codon:yes gene_type:complete
MSKSPINKNSVAKEGRMTRTAEKLEKKNEGGSDVLAALKAQLKIAKAPARRASIQKQINEILGKKPGKKPSSKEIAALPKDKQNPPRDEQGPRDIFED